MSSDLPREAGLSSSAALCVALVLALAKAAGREPEPVEVARMCSRIERDWTGADTGLLDQLASLLGEEGHALRLDMRTLDAAPVPLDARRALPGGRRLGGDPQPRRVGLQRTP